MTDLLNPRRTAVVVVDMQNDFVVPEGAMTKSGRDASPIVATVAAQAELVKAADAAGALIVFVKATREARCLNISPAALRLMARKESYDSTVEGTWGHEVIDDLKDITANAIVVRKSRSSAFANTNLDMLLRSNGIESVIVTGCVTEGCAGSTALDAQSLDYRCIVPEDCIASYSQKLHDAMLTLMRTRCSVIRSDEILGSWRSTRSGA